MLAPPRLGERRMGLVTATYLAEKHAKSKYLEENFGGFKQAMRRSLLVTHAERLSSQARSGAISDCAAFSDILAYAAAQFGGTDDWGVEAMMEDLKSVLIGQGLEKSKRNTGTYSLGFQPFLDTGFKEKFRDGGNQVQHAMAGLYIGYTYGWIGACPALLIEDEEQDKELYRVTFRLGSALNATNYALLPMQVMAELAA